MVSFSFPSAGNCLPFSHISTLHSLTFSPENQGDLPSEQYLHSDKRMDEPEREREDKEAAREEDRERKY